MVQNASGALPRALAMRLTNAASVAPITPPNNAKSSWMSPDAKRRRSLLYTSNYNNATVDVYDANTGKLMGQLGGLFNPYGECSDKSGNVYITLENSYSFYSVVEYAHGSLTPIRKLDDTQGPPIGCSVDPTTGNLAVSNWSSGDITIYAHASGRGTKIGPVAKFIWPPAYDDHGNLFVEGSFPDGLYEIASGRSTIKHLSLPFTIGGGGVLWDGKYVATIDPLYGGTFMTEVHRLEISHATVKVVSATVYTDTCHYSWAVFVQPALYRGKLIAGNTYCFTVYHIDYWNYARGGDPTSFIDGAKQMNTSLGQAISTK